MGNKVGMSFWEKESFLGKADLVIIGSGIVGLNAAIHFKEKYPNARVVILEKGMLPSGASTRNAGFACFGSITELLSDWGEIGEDGMLELVEKRWRGLQKLKSRVGDALQLNTCGGYELFQSDEGDIYNDCQEKIDYLNDKLFSITRKENIYQNEDSKIDSFGFKGISHLINNTAEGHIDTGSMMSGLLRIAREKGVIIFNGAEVNHYEETSNNISVELNDGRILNGNKLLICVNGFAKGVLREIDVVPARNQVLITTPIPSLKVKGTFHYQEGYYYFRNVGDRVLFGGGRNLSPKKEEIAEFGLTPIIQKELTRMLHEIILPRTYFEIDMWWSGILGVGNTKKPIIKKISDNIGVAVRMGGMGIAIGSLVGEEGAELF